MNMFNKNELGMPLGRECAKECLHAICPNADVKMKSQASVPRDVFPPTPPGPEGSNGNGLLRVQWVAGAWLRLPLPAEFTPFVTLRRPEYLLQIDENTTELAGCSVDSPP